MNALQNATSPYLLQHAANPVNWIAWHSKNNIEAQEHNKLIIVSIGYSACHWCHVMEHESFENEEVAQVMNQYFISVKVDREEHPEVDAQYMKAAQLMTGRGGWPLNVVTLPDGRPVWGGTYFKKEEWVNTLNQLHQLYTERPEKLYEYAEKLHEGIQNFHVIPQNQTEFQFDIELLEGLFDKWKRSFDWEFGGMARAPKFMMPNNYLLLLRYGFETQNQELLEFVNLTLTKMAWGGLFDTVGGGFSRYSVDLKWHVPHFEKMLYDNAQLITLYSEAYKWNKNPLFKETVEKTIQFLITELSNSKGGFYCALDADSLNNNNHLEEGAFYVWTKETIQELIQEDFELFAEVFNINEFGFWEHSNYVLIQNQSLETLAEKFNIPIDVLVQKKKNWEQTLFTAREKRSKPRLDDKTLTSWNGLLLKGLVEAYKAFGREADKTTAIELGKFITTHLWSPEGNLWHTYKKGQTAINGYLEDYAFVIEGCIALSQITFDENWLQQAKQLTDYALDFFYDESVGLFSFSSSQEPVLLSKHFEVEDNVIPASNSVMAHNLYQLSIYFNQPHYETLAKKMVQNIISAIDYASAFSNWILAHLNFSPQQKEVALCSEKALAFAQEIHSQYLPNVLIGGTSTESTLPFLKNRFQAQTDLFYTCQQKTCGLPESKFETWKLQFNV